MEKIKILKDVQTENVHGFEDRLSQAGSFNQVLEVYFRVRKDTGKRNWIETEKVAARLFELNLIEESLRFLEMANLERAIFGASKEAADTVVTAIRHAV